jgi:uncharacterized protein (DUF2236 family)
MDASAMKKPHQVRQPRSPAKPSLHALKVFPQLLGLPFSPDKAEVPELSPGPGNEEGYFGPGSVTWKVAREPLLVLGGASTLLMQVAHPLVAQGAVDHSKYATDPFGRLEETARWVDIVTFGTRGQADWIIDHVRKRHSVVQGTLDEESAGRCWPAGTPYSANHPDLVRWVHATIVHGLLRTYTAISGTLTPSEQDDLVREWNPIGIGMGMDEGGSFTSAHDLEAFITAQIASGSVTPGAASLEISRTILHAPMPVIQTLWPTVTFLSLGLLPPEMRKGYGVTWSAGQQALYNSLTSSYKRSRRMFRATSPSALRPLIYTPSYCAALRRCS